MVKFITLTKKNILKFSLAILVLICLFLLTTTYFNKNGTSYTYLPSSIHNEINKDFDGDGNDDNLIIDKTSSYYTVKIKTLTNEYTLKSSVHGEKLLDIYDSCSIKQDTIDLSRNGIPEIIISGYKNNAPLTYIFRWNNFDFEEVLSTQSNIIGFLDSHNSKTPQILYTLSEKGDEATNALLFNGLSIKNITFSSPKTPSLGVIQQFIDLIQLEYELTETPGLFTPYIDSNQLSILWKLSKDTYRYSFQTGYFNDITWDKNGTPTSLIWVLSFERVHQIDSKVADEEMLLSIKADIDQFGEYKISSIKEL